MNRFLLFGGLKNAEPYGGASDYIDSFDTLEAAQASVDLEIESHWFHVAEVGSGLKIVSRPIVYEASEGEWVMEWQHPDFEPPDLYGSA